MNLFYIIMFIVFAIYFPSSHAYSLDNNKQSMSHLNVTIFIVPETEACPPKGYPSYGSENYSECQAITDKDLEKWKQSGLVTVSYTIPPSVISLEPKLFEILNAYTSIPLTTPESRLSAIFVFKWDSPKTGTISLTRTRKQGNIPNMKWLAKLENKTHWIHHERADALLPAYGCEWRLQLGNHEWDFKTKP